MTGYGRRQKFSLVNWAAAYEIADLQFQLIYFGSRPGAAIKNFELSNVSSEPEPRAYRFNQ